MKKTKFYGMMLFAITVAFSSCTNVNEPDSKEITKLPFSETFSSSIGKFTSQSVIGDQTWGYNATGKYMMMTGKVGAVFSANEDWLISPEIDLTKESAAKLTFDHVVRYLGDVKTDATVWVSDNYVDGLPASATWTKLVTPEFTNASTWDLATSGEISLTAFVGKKVKIAFKYTSSATIAGTWEIKNFLVQKGEATPIIPTNSEVSLCGDLTTPVTTLLEDFSTVTNYTDIEFANWKVFKTKGDRNWQGKVYIPTSGPTESYAQASAHNGGTLTTEYEYWLVTPPLNVTAANSKILSFKTAKAYWTATSSLKVYILRCENGVTTRSEITSANIVKQTDTDNLFYSSGNIDLSAYTGVVYVGFQYIALGGASNSTTFRVDDVMFNVTTTNVSISSQAVLTAKVGEPYTYNITTNVVNPNGTTTIIATGIPTWATFTDNGDGTAKISGTPTSEGTHDIKLTATNNNISSVQDYTLVVTSPPPAGTNLVVNGSFEDWTGTLPVGFDVAIYNTGILKETAIKLTGANSVKHISGSSALKIQQEVAIVGGKKYHISYWVLDNSPKAKSRMWSFWLNGSTTLVDNLAELRPDALYSLDNANWVKVEYTLVAPATATKFRFEVRTYRESTSSDGDPIYYDDFSITEVQ